MSECRSATPRNQQSFLHNQYSHLLDGCCHAESPLKLEHGTHALSRTKVKAKHFTKKQLARRRLKVGGDK